MATHAVISNSLSRCRKMRFSVRGAVGHIRREAERLRIGRPAMVTLTYRNASDWAGRDVSNYITRLRRWLHRRGEKLRYVWVAEMQDRGAVHYHILVWARARIPRPDRSGMWSHGSTNVVRVKHGGCGYITKYLTKTEDISKFPKGCRIYGVGGLSADSRADMRWWRLPSYIRDRYTPDFDFRRVPGGGFLSRAYGIFEPSRYIFHFISHGHTFLTIKPEYQTHDSVQRFLPAGY